MFPADAAATHYPDSESSFFLHIDNGVVSHQIEFGG
jgi:hypothetical protein